MIVYSYIVSVYYSVAFRRVQIRAMETLPPPQARLPKEKEKRQKVIAQVSSSRDIGGGYGVATIQPPVLVLLEKATSNKNG